MRSPWMLVVGPVLVAASIVLGVAVRLDADGSVFGDLGIGELTAGWRDTWLLEVAGFLSGAGGGWIAAVAVPLVGAALLVLARRRRAAIAWIAALAASAVVVQLMKAAFARERPLDAVVQLASFSYPSGHVGNAAALATVLVLLLPRWWTWALGILWTLGMMLSRVLLGAHWFSDTLGGLLVGVGTVLIVWALLEPWMGAPGSRTGDHSPREVPTGAGATSDRPAPREAAPGDR